MKYFIIFGFWTIWSGFSFGQEIKDTVPKVELTTIAQVSHGNSYITFPTDIGNIEPLWIEGNLIPNFYIRKSKNSRLMGVFTPQVIIRMYQEESYPVRTPSYLPQITVYYLLSPKTEQRSLSIFGKLVHHSNGQDGDFYLENGDINLKTGDFSTNYYELGLIKTNYNKRSKTVQFMSTSVQVHAKALTADELQGAYSLYRWNSMVSIFKIPMSEVENKDRNASISVKGETSWMFGEVNDWSNVSLNRLNMSFTLFYHPKFLEDIGLFVQAYHGLDYYNMYFSHKITMLRFGIMTEKLRF